MLGHFRGVGLGFLGGGNFRAQGLNQGWTLLRENRQTNKRACGVTWRFMGRKKWGCKPPNMDYNYTCPNKPHL